MRERWKLQILAAWRPVHCAAILGGLLHWGANAQTPCRTMPVEPISCSYGNHHLELCHPKSIGALVTQKQMKAPLGTS